METERDRDTQRETERERQRHRERERERQRDINETHKRFKEFDSDGTEQYPKLRLICFWQKVHTQSSLTRSRHKVRPINLLKDPKCYCTYTARTEENYSFLGRRGGRGGGGCVANSFLVFFRRISLSLSLSERNMFMGSDTWQWLCVLL